MRNIYQDHADRLARVAPALAGTSRNNRITEADLIAAGVDADDLTDLAATGAIGGSWSTGYYAKPATHNGRH